MAKGTRSKGWLAALRPHLRNGFLDFGGERTARALRRGKRVERRHARSE